MNALQPRPTSPKADGQTCRISAYSPADRTQKPGSDLSRISFPTFVLEPRSMLERITDFLSHPDLIFGSVVLRRLAVKCALLSIGLQCTQCWPNRRPERSVHSGSPLLLGRVAYQAKGRVSLQAAIDNLREPQTLISLPLPQEKALQPDSRGDLPLSLRIQRRLSRFLRRRTSLAPSANICLLLCVTGEQIGDLWRIAAEVEVFGQ